MFRNPRENIDLPADQKLQHSTGRPPSPPAFPPTRQLSSNVLRQQERRHQRLPLQQTMTTKINTVITPSKLASSKLQATPKSSKPKGKANGNILTFFKKAEELQDRLFVPEHRFNELGGSVKRRKRDEELEGNDDVREVGGLPAVEVCLTPPVDQTIARLEEEKGLENLVAPVQLRRGPFQLESDSEDEGFPSGFPSGNKPVTAHESPKNDLSIEMNASDNSKDISLIPPSLKKEDTSYSGIGDFEGFENMEDFEHEEFEGEGEEFQERTWMAEQSRLDMDDGNMEAESMDYDVESSNLISVDNEEEAFHEKDLPGLNAPTCPMCSINLAGVTDDQASVHVNNCLDGNPTPLPVEKPHSATTTNTTVARASFIHRPPRAGQQNPFSLASAPKDRGPKSAFAQLMSGHTEESAWKSAAAAEAAARGKPSYERTCPFYKILPGFSICVDAFRYGAVDGCQAYFLSHFHSDHYIGLTSSWRHGPIYCSRVTGNLVRQQLRVDPKWVMDLEFEEEIEVPKTDGVRVTMISANHCPGSSLFLFQKVVGKGKNPKVQRVLHCGDFRACRTHVEHPLLRPNVVDVVTGKSKEQNLDVCYLDTTYLNPKYAFPCQEEVITACADMCVSLNNTAPDASDKWETMKKERAGSGMVQFLHNGATTIKTEEQEPSDGRPLTSRGRLLVVVGTYSIGKERVCLGIARALGSKIYAPPAKQRICACLEDAELSALLTTNPHEAQVHMTPLFEIRADTLDDYLKDYRDTFTRAVGFRPSGWNYRPPNSRFIESPSVSTVLYGSNWKSSYGVKDLVPQRGSTQRTSCFGVPYSEHSSFRELTMFCCALRIERIVPTVNVGSAKGREKMRLWCERWAQERKKSGLFPAESF